jgi:ubiquinone/menaquinone biosynthesis C-methylase UbiE
MTSELFDMIAADYDAWYESELGRTIDGVERDLVSRLFLPSGPKILEVGCGTGQYTTWLVNKGFKVTAVDVSNEMIRRAQAKILGLEKEVEWINADIVSLYSSLGMYDGILSITAFEFIHDPEKVLANLFNHIVVGGCLVVGIIAGESSWSDFYERNFKNDPNSVFSQATFYTEEEIRSWRVGGRLEIGKGLYFSPLIKSISQAIDIENKQSGKPGFLMAKWVKE